MTIYRHPPISRETRLLLITVFVSIAALWALARIRFQERPATAAAVPPVLAQFRPSSGFDDLARLIADVRPGITAAVFASDRGAPALRIGPNVAVTLVPAVDRHLASDRATGLTLLRSSVENAPGLMPWAPRILDYPRYLVIADLAAEHVSLRPMFVGALLPVQSEAWSGEIWRLPPATTLAPGTFVFTTDRAFAGLGVEHDGSAAIVPASLLLSNVERLLRDPQKDPGVLGVTVQALTPAIAGVSGATTGVVVTAVELASPAAGALAATDVIEVIDDQAVSLEGWRARIARLSAGETLSMRIRNTGVVRHVTVTAAPATKVPAPPEDAAFGLRLRAISKIGVEVLAVEPGSRAARTEILSGDVITVAGPYKAPTLAQLTRALAALPEDGAMLVAITRGNQHRVAVIGK